MNKLKPSSLIVGDLLVILSFVWIGRGSHSLSTADAMAGLSTAAPFVVSWFVIVPWFGLYRSEINQSWRRLAPRLLLAWFVVAGPIALILRTLMLGRSVPGDIIPSFAIVSLSYIGFLALIWRLGYMWWRTPRQKEDPQGSLH